MASKPSKVLEPISELETSVNLLMHHFISCVEKALTESCICPFLTHFCGGSD